MRNSSLNGLSEYLFDKKDLIIVDVHQSDLWEAEETFREYNGKRVLEEVEESESIHGREEKVTLCYIVDSERLSNILEALCERGLITRMANTFHTPYSLRSKVSSYLFNLI